MVQLSEYLLTDTHADGTVSITLTVDATGNMFVMLSFLLWLFLQTCLSVMFELLMPAV